MGRWGDGEMRRWGDGGMRKNNNRLLASFTPLPPPTSPPPYLPTSLSPHLPLPPHLPTSPPPYLPVLPHLPLKEISHGRRTSCKYLRSC
nr:hypothetical protein [Nostoc sp. CreGUA01]